MRNNNKISTRFDTARTENEDYFKIKFNKFKAKASIPIDMKLFALNSNKYPYSYDQHSYDIIKWPHLKSIDFHSHTSQFTKKLSFMNLEGDTLIQIKNGWIPLFLTSANLC